MFIRFNAYDIGDLSAISVRANWFVLGNGLLATARAHQRDGVHLHAAHHEYQVGASRRVPGLPSPAEIEGKRLSAVRHAVGYSWAYACGLAS